jgi:60 kDa SS-A/Ro ribonucleoprotein
MKDMPALLVAVLASKDKSLFEKTFPRVIDNGKMLRNFVQIMRSGATGRKSLGSLPKRMVREWFEARKAEQIFKQSVGQAPSFGDILKMVHPKPKDAEREALYGYFIGREIDADKLPEIVKAFERFKNGDVLEVPAVPFQMLTALPISTNEWTEIARNAAWQMTRMNLNTFQRHGVFKNAEMVELIANRLRDREAIRRAKVFPYQLLSAYSAASNNAEIPRQITEALQDAMEIATENVPEIRGKVYVFPDISGSMHSSVTGFRKGATSAVRCIDVAALVAAAILRKNPTAEVIPFSDHIVKAELNPRDSVMTNAQKLASLPSGGTNCSAPLVSLNAKQASGDVAHLRFRQRIVDRHADSRTLRRKRNRNDETMELFQIPQHGRETRLHRHPALRPHASQRTRGHFERRRIFRSGVYTNLGIRGRNFGRRTLGWCH